MPNFNCDPRLCLVCNNNLCSRNRNPRFLTQPTNESAQNTTNNMQMPKPTNNTQQNPNVFPNLIDNIDANMINLNNNFNVVLSAVNNLQEELKTIKSLPTEDNAVDNTEPEVYNTMLPATTKVYTEKTGLFGRKKYKLEKPQDHEVKLIEEIK